MKTGHLGSNKTRGFTLVEIMIVVAIIGLLAAIAIPNFVRARNSAQLSTCMSNLRQIESAVHQWAIENRKSDTDIAVWSNINPYIKNGPIHCPVHPTGLYGSSAGRGNFVVSEEPNCTHHGKVSNPTP